jgi:hypothetical protein
MQYTPATIVPVRMTFSSRPVKIRCQMSWPIIRPKKNSRKYVKIVFQPIAVGSK